MVLAYFMRKDYEAEIAIIRREHEAKIAKDWAEIAKDWAEIARKQAEVARTQAEIAKTQAEADRAVIREQNAVIIQLLERNRLLLEIIAQQRNGNRPLATPAPAPSEPSDQIEE